MTKKLYATLKNADLDSFIYIAVQEFGPLSTNGVIALLQICGHNGISYGRIRTAINRLATRNKIKVLERSNKIKYYKEAGNVND